jgi:adenylate cyclase
LIIAVAAGFLPFCILAWIYDVRAGRIVRTEPVATPAAVSNIASIAILPFADLSQAHDQDWFCDGLAEEIIDALCCVRGLRVASRTASFRFRDGSVDPREIGRLLNVGAILEGSVRKAGEQLRVTAQLIGADDGYHLWSETFDRRLEDVFAIQSEIARSVAHALKLSLTGPAAGRERYAPHNLAAYEYYLRGRQLAGQTTLIAWRHAPQMFRRAIELDPEYAQAHAGLADILANLVLWRYVRPEEVMAEATQAAARALALAPDLAEAHVAQGHIRSLCGDDAGAVSSFERAIALNPELHEANYYYARHCYARADYSRAAALFQAAHQARPDDYTVLSLAVSALEAAGEHQRAAEILPSALQGLIHQAELENENVRAHYMAGQLYLRMGDAESGRRHVETALRLKPDDFGTLYNAACFYSLAGELQRALDLLDHGMRTGAGNLAWIEQDPDLKPLWGHPRFHAIVARHKAAPEAAAPTATEA